VPVSLVENCEFTGSSSDNTAAVTLTGDPRPPYSWVAPHLLALCNNYQGPGAEEEEEEGLESEREGEGEESEVDSIGVASIACSSTQDEDEDEDVMLSSSSSEEEEDSGEEVEEGNEEGRQQQHYHHQVSNHSRKVSASKCQQLKMGRKYKSDTPGVEIRGRPVIQDHHFLGKDDHVLTDGSPSGDLIFALIKGRTSLGQDYHVIQIW
jgi:hypothetical protein